MRIQTRVISARRHNEPRRTNKFPLQRCFPAYLLVHKAFAHLAQVSVLLLGYNIGAVLNDKYVPKRHVLYQLRTPNGDKPGAFYARTAPRDEGAGSFSSHTLAVLALRCLDFSGYSPCQMFRHYPIEQRLEMCWTVCVTGDVTQCVQCSLTVLVRHELARQPYCKRTANTFAVQAELLVGDQQSMEYSSKFRLGSDLTRHSLLTILG